MGILEYLDLSKIAGTYSQIANSINSFYYKALDFYSEIQKNKTVIDLINQQHPIFATLFFFAGKRKRTIENKIENSKEMR